MRISVIGAVAGAVVCAISRSLVIIIAVPNVSPIFFLPSASIGILVGAVAGAIGRPLIGAGIGAVLSAVIFELFMLPCASLIGTFGALTGDTDADTEFLKQTVTYLVQMGIAGAIGGGVGGAVGSRDMQRSVDSPNGSTEELSDGD